MIDAEDGDRSATIEWELLSSAHYDGRLRAVGSSFTFTPTAVGLHPVRARITDATSLDAARGSALVVEAATENEELKFRIFSDLDRVAAPDAILVMSKGLESVGGVDGLVEIPGVAQTPAGTDRRIVSVEDGVLLNYGPRTDRVLESVVTQLYGGSGGDA